MDTLEIDGSFGEGGGQVLRTAVSLSCMTGRPVRISRIRAGRKKPGLARQHLAAVGVLARACGAKTRGLAEGSTELEFAPGNAWDGTAAADVGTAGSIPLILSAVIPAASIRGGMEVSLAGGTDVSWSPTIEYTGRVLREAYSRMGIDYSINVERRGYYPRGGGSVSASIQPCRVPRPILLGSDKPEQAELLCSYSKMPRDKVEAAAKEAACSLEEDGCSIHTEIGRGDADDPGGTALLYSSGHGHVRGADALYKEGGFGGLHRGFARSDAGADDHLADMLVVPASLADGTSVITVDNVSGHLGTCLYVASRMTGCRYGYSGIGRGHEVWIEGRSDARVH
ncbi:RNA 3'-terminal phosphate cyclase [Cenarchaeum symbiosum A]|uniref:RNA 3'-terminal phosphate cyclase n=1 Tax=Cenarchaeum symbiosum (strain A) TaxID=414004 RepID=A0RXV7_CENSY|nr:RNA 3'-terminal phosphate cyclase [Cenarchaeum symbiosum A]